MQRVKKTVSVKKIWVLGAGKFGRIAIDRIVRHLPDVDITVVDNRQKVCELTGVTFCFEDGIAWLVENLERECTVDMIIPAIPVHVAAEWLREKCSEKYTVSSLSLPLEFIEKLPHPIQDGTSKVYVSHADFLCPDNCNEPRLLCSYTGEKRGKEMFRLLRELKSDEYNSLVIRSHQLLPGVGGIYPQDLWNLLDHVGECVDKPLCIATACRCHGVVDGMWFS